MMKTMTCLAAVLLALAGDTRAADETAAALLARIEAMQEKGAPSLIDTKLNDQERMQKFFGNLRDWGRTLGAMELEFYQRFPDDPKAEELIVRRWERLGKTYDMQEAVAAEARQFVEARPKSPRVNDARFQLAEATMNVRERDRDATGLAEAAEAFMSAAPDDERGGRLLTHLAAKDPANRAAINRRIATAYPKSQWGVMAAGKVRQADMVGKPFELSFTDAVSGRKVSMADLRGKVVVIDFWATWCGPCVAEMPKVKELYARYHDKGLEVIGVSLDQPEAQGGLAKLKAFAAKESIPWLQYYQGNGWESEFSRSWGVTSIPSVFVVDAKGNLKTAEGRGQLERLVPELLGLPVPPAAAPAEHE